MALTRTRTEEYKRIREECNKIHNEYVTIVVIVVVVGNNSCSSREMV